METKRRQIWKRLYRRSGSEGEFNSSPNDCAPGSLKLGGVVGTKARRPVAGRAELGASVQFTKKLGPCLFA